MRGPLGFLAALTSDGTHEEGRPAANVGAAFLIAAVVVAVVGLKWLGSSGDDGDAIADGWALGNTSEASSSNTTIPPTPAAVAVRLGTETSSASDDIIGTSPTTRPGSTPTTRPGTAAGTTGTGGTGTTGGGSGTTTGGGSGGGGGGTTETTTGPTITESTTSTTEDTTTTSSETTTTNVPPAPEPQSAAPRGLLSGLLSGLFGGL